MPEQIVLKVNSGKGNQWNAGTKHKETQENFRGGYLKKSNKANKVSPRPIKGHREEKHITSPPTKLEGIIIDTTDQLKRNTQNLEDMWFTNWQQKKEKSEEPSMREKKKPECVIIHSFTTKKT